MHLSDKDQKRIRSYYESSLEHFGDSDHRSVHWTEREGQLKRFAVLLSVADIRGKRILDVGSGLGNLYGYLKEQKIECDYTGIDIIPDFVAKAREKFPDAHFIERDIFDVNESFDIVLASGALSFKVENNESHYKKMIENMYTVATEAVAFNMLHIGSHVNDDTYAAYDPNEIADFCRGFVNRVEIMIDYLPQDFTIYLYKN